MTAGNFKSTSQRDDGGLPRVVARIAAARSNDSAITATMTFAKTMGVAHLLVGTLRDNQTIEPATLAAYWPSAWLTSYLGERKVEVDPVVVALRKARRPLPFFWADVADQSRDTNMFFGAASEHGLVDGLMVPISADGLLGGVSFSGVKIDRDPVRLTVLHLAAIYLHSRLAYGGPLPGFVDPESMLTPRQTQVLSLLAIGKTYWEVGRILGIDATTARFHLIEAARRLGVATRTQAILKAIGSGLIEAG